MDFVSPVEVIILSTLSLLLLLLCFVGYRLVGLRRELWRSEVKLDALERHGQNLQQEVTRQLHLGQVQSLEQVHSTLQKAMQDIREQIRLTLQQNAEHVGQKVAQLTNQTNQRLREISGQVEKRLDDGFAKTTATFTDIVKRLALIDEAQKKITELSSNVVSLQEILADKRSRGTFGEVQMSALIHNVIPKQHFSMQHTLSNSKRADCILFLPEPTGNIVIDAKFPLETYRLLENDDLGVDEKRRLKQQFRQDIKKHVSDIAEKYIIAGETADGAMLFIPAEAIFAEIHAYYPDIVDIAQRAKVWLVSPTTMMAVLTTARAVLKDAATRQQVHLIQEHLRYLSEDFLRFEKRMDNLARHITQAHNDVSDVNISAKKITSRFQKIEMAELPTMAEEE